MWEDRKQLWRREGKVVTESISGPPLFRTRRVTVVDKPAESMTAEVAETHVKHD
jgi:hypothetical protein